MSQEAEALKDSQSEHGQRFVKVNSSLINIDRLLIVQHKPELSEGPFYTPEHYLAVFDTGEKLRLEPADGASLVGAL